MSQRTDAVFENGVFRPEVPVSLADGQRVSLSVESRPAPTDDLSDVGDLLDVEFMDSCRGRAREAPSLDEVRVVLSAFTGSLADRLSEERDERKREEWTVATINVDEAQAHPREIIAGVNPGEPLVIIQDGQPLATLIRVQPHQWPCTAGSAKDGKHWMASDFDAPLEEFREYIE